MNDTTADAATLEDAIAAARQEYRDAAHALRESHRDRMAELTGRLRDARARARAARPRARRAPTVVTPAGQAGRHLSRVAAIIRRRGTAYQADIVAQLSEKDGTKGMSGTVSWAIKALLQEGKIEPTGRKRHRSREYRWVR